MQFDDDLNRVQQCVEALCLNGCEAVRATILALEEDVPVSQTEGLDREQRAAVLRELKAIMAVYDR
ncbi:MAG: hypothetical protein P8076_04260 [Gammaproteobacteria bacterium]